MKKDANEYLFNAAVRYLGKYPATKRKIKQYLQKKIKNNDKYQKISFEDDPDKNLLIQNIILKLEELKIIDENSYLESMFNYYQESLFSIKKIKNKLYQKGFDIKIINDFISNQLEQNPNLEIDILGKYIRKKKLENLKTTELKKKLYQQNFTENSIYKLIKE